MLLNKMIKILWKLLQVLSAILEGGEDVQILKVMIFLSSTTCTCLVKWEMFLVKHADFCWEQGERVLNNRFSYGKCPDLANMINYR